MEAQKALYERVCRILTVDSTQLQLPENKKIHKAVGVLHKDYLVAAAKEAKQVIKKKQVTNEYGLMIKIYNRKLKEHQALMLLIQLFEVAMRTHAAIVLSRKYSSTNNDDLYFRSTQNSKHQKIKNKILNRAQMTQKVITPQMSTIDMFHILMMNDIQQLYKSHWSNFSAAFQNTSYKTNTLTPLHTKAMFDARFERIRKYRNELYHNNPGTSGWQQIIKDIEEILVQLHYNVKDAVENIDPWHRIINLQYRY